MCVISSLILPTVLETACVLVFLNSTRNVLKLFVCQSSLILTAVLETVGVSFLLNSTSTYKNCLCVIPP